MGKSLRGRFILEIMSKLTSKGIPYSLALYLVHDSSKYNNILHYLYYGDY